MRRIVYVTRFQPRQLLTAVVRCDMVCRAYHELTPTARRMTDRIESELLRGAAPLAVLQLLDRSEMYGYQMVEALAKDSNGALALGQSTLYPLLYNLEAKGFIRAEQREADSGRVRKYYRLTAQGRRYLAAGRKRWRALTEEMDRLGLLGPDAMSAAR